MLNLKRISECDIEAETKDQNLSMLQMLIIIFSARQKKSSDYIAENRALSLQFNKLMDKYRKLKNGEEINTGYMQRFINMMTKDDKEKNQTSVIAYITFRSMRGQEAVLNAYKSDIDIKRIFKA